MNYWKKINENKNITSKEIENKSTPKAINITLLSTSDVLNMSFGEVKSIETYHYKTMKPVPLGLYCEQIFGAKHDLSCACGLYVGKLYEDLICPECNSQVLSFDKKKNRFGHIVLATPCFHIWFLNSNTWISQILDISHNQLAKIIYNELFVNQTKIDLVKHALEMITFEEYEALPLEESQNYRTGGESLNYIFNNINVTELIEVLNKKTDLKSKNRNQLLRKILKGNTNLGNVIVKMLPVLPAAARPITLLDNGNYGTVDVNQFYRCIIIRSKRLEELLSIRDSSEIWPETVFCGGRILLQLSVDMLFDNEALKKPMKTKGNRVLKSISMLIKGKHGILRLYLLGKRTDFSGRSVIITNPNLKLTEVGIPLVMAKELFKPFLINRLVKKNIALGISDAIFKLQANIPEVKILLQEIIKSKFVLINRAPSLHRTNLQAFRIKLTNHNAIELPQLVCEGFNADHDGDTVGIYPTISLAANLDSRFLMHSELNIFSAASGKPIIQPVREMRMGLYWLSDEYKECDNPVVIYGFEDLQMIIEKSSPNFLKEKIIFVDNFGHYETTPGRVILNQLLPSEIRNYNVVWSIKLIHELIEKLYNNYGFEVLSVFLDELKQIGLHYITLAGVSMSLEDLQAPKNKSTEIAYAHKLINNILDLKKQLLPSEVETLKAVIWYTIIDKLTKQMTSSLSNESNDIYLSIQSQSRCNITQLRQLSVARGLLSDLNGDIITTPILNSYKEGLGSLAYFLSSYGARKGVVNRSIDTQSGGKVTRSLIDALHKIFVSELDCGNTNFTSFNTRSFYEDIVTRMLAEDALGYVKGQMISNEISNEFKANNLKPLIRHISDCQAATGVCAYCYGFDLTKKKIVEPGLAVGIMAAQSSGEPILQLTMRTFHTGGVVENNDLLCFVNALHDCKVSLNTVDFVPFQQNDNLFKYQARRQTVIWLGEQKCDITSGSIVTVQNGQIVSEGDLIAINIRTELFVAEYNDVILPSGDNEFLTTETGKHIELPKNTHILSETMETGKVFAKKEIELSKSKDIIGDLNDLEQVIEVRRPQNICILAPSNGIIELQNEDGNYILSLLDSETNETRLLTQTTSEDYVIVKNGETVIKGQELTRGQINYQDILSIFDEKVAKQMLVANIQKIYGASGINLNCKHAELLVKRMFSFVEITNKDKTVSIIEKENLTLESMQEYSSKQLIVGITKAATFSFSFLSAASFRQTKKVMAKASLLGLTDNLVGLKENLIVGKPIPCGTYSKHTENIADYANLPKNIRAFPVSQLLKQVNTFDIIKHMRESLNVSMNSELSYNEYWHEEIFYQTLEKLQLKYGKND